MTTDEKDLLRKDLCARLPYSVIVSVTDGTIKYNAYIESISYKNIQVSPISDSNFTAYTFYKISEIKPYLRPMSSMTEEERKEYEGFIIHREHINAQGQEWDIDCFSFGSASRLIDWLNRHHFDYRGLIPMGLALQAPEGMYK